MILTLNLSLELELYLLQEADRHGLSIAELALQLLASSMSEKQIETIKLLQSWIDDADGEEQQEAGEYLTQALDDDRLSDRKLFPLELKGITW